MWLLLGLGILGKHGKKEEWRQLRPAWQIQAVDELYLGLRIVWKLAKELS